MRININHGHFHVYFIYWTHLNLFATMITTTLGAMLVTLHYFNKIKIKKVMTASLKLYWALWNQSIVFACLISGSYWILLHKAQQIDLNNILIHVTNVIVPVFDLFIVSFPSRYRNFFYVTTVGVGYGFFTMIYQFSGGVDKQVLNWNVYKFQTILSFPETVKTLCIQLRTGNNTHWERLSSLWFLQWLQ